jgi:hypothetical protein
MRMLAYPSRKTHGCRRVRLTLHLYGVSLHAIEYFCCDDRGSCKCHDAGTAESMPCATSVHSVGLGSDPDPTVDPDLKPSILHSPPPTTLSTRPSLRGHIREIACRRYPENLAIQT